MIYICECDDDNGLDYQAEVDVGMNDFGTLKARIESCSTFDADNRETVIGIEDIPPDVAECLVLDAMNRHDEVEVSRFLENEYADLDNKFRKGG